MAVNIASIKYIPDLPGAKALAGSDLLHVSQSGVDGQLSLTALTTFINNATNPIGKLLFSPVKGFNPNTLFPGQKWIRFGQNRTIRVCADDENNINTLIGADSIALSGGHIPSHNHSVDIGTTVSGQHAHTGVTSGAGSHSHTAWTDAQGQHAHNFQFIYGDFRNTGANIPAGPGTGNVINLQTDAQGNHAHNVGVGAVGDHQHALYIDGAGMHAHEIHGATGYAGSGAAFGIVNASILVCCWQRTG